MTGSLILSKSEEENILEKTDKMEKNPKYLTNIQPNINIFAIKYLQSQKKLQ